MVKRFLYFTMGGRKYQGFTTLHHGKLKRGKGNAAVNWLTAALCGLCVNLYYLKLITY